jgi:peptidoglycan/xylan/chitin deacetylase (PgdA/CDA1 family)
MFDGSILQRLIRRAGGFVLALHEIPPQQMAGFIEGMQPAKPVHLDELVQRRKRQRSCAGLFAITVDDGVATNVRALSRLCVQRGWPVTHFLPTQYLDTREPMAFQLWWRLKPLLPHTRLELRSGTVDLSRPASLKAFVKKIESAWYFGRAESYFPVTLELARIVEHEHGLSIEELRAPAPIGWQEVAELSRSDLVRFESHGVSHTAVAALREEEIAFEMRESQRIVSEHTGRPCRHFCYPFGGNASIGALAPQVARRFYDSAATMNLGPVDTSDPWLMPRIPLYPENSLLSARMKVVLKCSRGNARKKMPDGPEGTVRLESTVN